MYAEETYHTTELASFVSGYKNDLDPYFYGIRIRIKEHESTSFVGYFRQQGWWKDEIRLSRWPVDSKGKAGGGPI